MRTGTHLLAAALGITLLATLILGGSAAAAGIDGLRNETPIPKTNKEAQVHRVREPGQRYRRDFATQPPLIPHKVAKYEISRNENECMGCHGMENYIARGAPSLSRTHYVGREGSQQMSAPDAGRWNCNQCHVPQTGARALVDNYFQRLNE